MTVTALRPKLNPSVARKIITKVIAYKRADRALKEAKRDKAQLDEYAHLIERGVKAEGTVDGTRYEISRWRGGGGQIFSLKEYLEAGHAITKEMEPFVHDRDTYNVWDVEPIEGPAEP
jgi:hypothetical protein